MATLIEFVFAPPAIALAIGAYLNVQFRPLIRSCRRGRLHGLHGAQHRRGDHCGHLRTLRDPARHLRTAGVHGGGGAGFSLANFTKGGWAGPTVQLAAISGIFAAIPFAIWFFLAIEGVAMAAEEAKDPQRSIPIAYIGGILTLVLLAMGVMVFAGGVGDWTKLANINDPLPQAMKTIVGESSGWLHMLVWLGLFGLVASFHGIILGYSRQIFAQARSGYLPAWFAEVHPRFKTPHRAIVAGGVVGIAAIFSDEVLSFGGQSLTANIVTMAVLGAL
jgi:ethanolamine permease